MLQDLDVGRLAGYTEISKTVEQTVHREVMEEAGLRMKNLRYYKSQPWGMVERYPRHDLPAKDDGISLTREMIRIFEEGKEPKYRKKTQKDRRFGLFSKISPL